MVLVALRVGIVMTSTAVVWAASQSTVSPLPSIPISIEAAPVPLNPQDRSQNAIGDFVYAGGLALTSRESNRLHGLSDLEVMQTDRLVAVGDDGIFLDARLTFDNAQRLVGVTEARVTVLTGEDGKQFSEKTYTDAEGLAILTNGDRLVSFERRDRILLYPANGGPPRRVPAPDVAFPSNGGAEALTADPDAAPDAYVVGAEISGDTWNCRLSAGCIKAAPVSKPQEFGLVAIKRIVGLGTVYLLRAFDAARGSRVSLRVVRSGQIVGRMDIERPLTVDNFEAVAAVPRIDNGVRLYLLSDDNGGPPQRTLLLAFDWSYGSR
jgi:hypothetical protein